MVSISFRIIRTHEITTDNFDNQNFDRRQRGTFPRNHMSPIKDTIITAHTSMNMQSAFTNQAHGIAQLNGKFSIISRTIASPQLGIVFFQIIITGLLQTANHRHPTALNILFLQNLSNSFAYISSR